MSDLISRGALYNELNRLEDLARTRVLHTPTNSPCYTRYVAQLNERTALKHLVADVKTAYNVDAVVAEIQKESIPIFDEDSETNVKVIGTKEVTEIVRKGGVNE